MVIAEEGAVDLAELLHGVLHHDLVIVAKRILDGRIQFVSVCRSHDADGGSAAGRFHDHRVAQLPFAPIQFRLLAPAPCVLPKRDEVDDRNARIPA